MPRRARRRAVAALILAPALTACGFGVQTDQVYQPAVGDNLRGEEVSVLSAVVVSTTDGLGTFSAALVNSDAEEPVTLTAMTGSGVEITLAAPVVVQPDTLVDLTTTGNVLVVGDDVVAGSYASLALAFDNGEELEMQVPIVDGEGVFSEVVEASPPAEPESEPDSESESEEATAP